MGALSTFWETKKAATQAQKVIIQAPARSETTIGLLPLLLNAQNRQNFDIQFFDQGGKKKIVKYKYMQRGIESENITTPTGLNYCETENDIAYLEGQKECTGYIARKFTIPLNYTRKFDENLDSFFQDGLMTIINPMLTAINKDLIATFEAARGFTSAGNVTPISAQGFVSYATREINRAFDDTVALEFENLEHNGMLMMAGGGKVRSYANVLRRGGLNDKGQVVDLGILDDKFIYQPDTTLDTVIGTPDNALVWKPGAAQFLEYFENRGEYAIMDEEFIKDVIIVQFGGFNIAFDITISKNYCDKALAGWVVTLEKNYDFWNYDTDIFKVGDTLESVNWLERFIMT